MQRWLLNWPFQLTNNSITHCGVTTLSQKDWKPIPQNSSYIAVEQKMVNRFPALLIHAAPVHHNDMHLLQVIQDQDLSKRCWPNKETTHIWALFLQMYFEVRSFYRVLCPPVGFSFPWKNVWRNKASPRVAFSVWTTMLGKVFFALQLNNARKEAFKVWSPTKHLAKTWS